MRDWANATLADAADTQVMGVGLKRAFLLPRDERAYVLVVAGLPAPDAQGYRGMIWRSEQDSNLQSPAS